MSKCTKAPLKTAFPLKIKACLRPVIAIFFQRVGKNAQLATTFIFLFSPLENFSQKIPNQNRQF